MEQLVEIHDIIKEIASKLERFIINEIDKLTFSKLMIFNIKGTVNTQVQVKVINCKISSKLLFSLSWRAGE